MKQYDKIYVPCDENDSALFAAWGEEAADYVGAIQEKENVIVLTIEELREVWKAAQDYQRQAPDFFTFSKYLQSKGITI
jgi:hypothetical protein